MSRADTAALAEFTRRHRITPNTVVQGAWAVLMAAYSERDDVVFGVTTSGRGDTVDDVESVVGLLINTTPTRIRLDRDQPVADWLRLLQKENVAARAFEHTPLVQIQAWSEVPNGKPLFEYIFVFESYPDGPLQDEGRADSAATGLRLRGSISREQANYPLTVAVRPGPEFGLGLFYDRARFDDDTIRQLGEQLTGLLRAIVEGPERSVGDLGVLVPQEYRRMVEEWNATSVLVPGVGGVHELISARAVECPGVVAVVCGDVSLSYAELEARSNRLARYLRGLGVGVGSVVGLCFGRGVEMVVSVLAVWKAGVRMCRWIRSIRVIVWRLWWRIVVCRWWWGVVAWRRILSRIRGLLLFGWMIRWCSRRLGVVFGATWGSGVAGSGCLCDLYVGFDGCAEGSGGSAWWVGELDGGFGFGVWGGCG
ncbi:condensation domain-containing protein [Catenulispora yoronensis]